MMRRVVVVLATAVAVLAGCASAPPRVAPASATAGIHRFGVVSVVAPEITRMHVGVTVFGNEHEVRPIGSWNLDAAYEDELGAAAARALSATRVPVDPGRGAFMKVNDPNGPWDAPAFSGANWSGIEDAVRAVCQQASLDALLVVARRRSNDVFGGTNQRLQGIGLYSRGNLSLLHLLADVGLMDCRTGQPVAHHAMTWTVPVDASLAASPLAGWTPETEERVRQQLLGVTPAAWESTLRSLLP